MNGNPEASTKPLCPRCCGLLYDFEGDRGVLSRVSQDPTIVICGDCGKDEARRDAKGASPIPANEWPI